jgi:hypothetical protein
MTVNNKEKDMFNNRLSLKKNCNDISLECMKDTDLHSKKRRFIQIITTTSPPLSRKKHLRKVFFDWMQKPPIHRNARFEDGYCALLSI